MQGLIAIFMVAVSGCAVFGGSGEPGLFAVHDGGLQRLDGEREWELETWPERSNLSPGVAFLVRDPRLAAAAKNELDNMVFLHRVAWVRSEISEEGDILPVEGSQWGDAAIQELQVPVILEPDPEDSEAVRVTPQSELKQGLYTLRLQTPPAVINARVGVKWSAVDRRAYAAANCVDRYQGSEVSYRLCADQEQAFAGKWLEVHLVQPETRVLPGESRELVVKGVVLNTSDRPRRVPMLEAQLVTDQGVVVKRWEFSAVTDELQPGASTPFASELPNPPPDASNVHVTFSPVDSQLNQAVSPRKAVFDNPQWSTR